MDPWATTAAYAARSSPPFAFRLVAGYVRRMLRMRKSATLLLGGALTLALTACGSDSPDGASGSTPSSTTSASGSATPSSSGTTPAPGNSGIVPDATWAGLFKKALPPLAGKSDDEVATAARKVCSDFEATPDKATATTILKEAESALGLDSTQSRIFASGAITHFCTDQQEAWTTASLG